MSETAVLARVLAHEPGGVRSSAALLTALLAHAALVALATLAAPQLPPAAAVVEVTEIDFELPAATAPEPEPRPLAEPAPFEPPRNARRAPTPAVPPKPRPAARASAAPLRTVAEGVKTAEEPVRFVADATGSAFGFGSAAAGGSALVGDPAALAEPSSGPASKPAAAGRTSLRRAPALAESDPCRGFFPARARVDRGQVALKVKVERDGSVRSIGVTSETPLGHGFGVAARDCLRSKRFSPALNHAGQAVAVVSPITVRFTR